MKTTDFVARKRTISSYIGGVFAIFTLVVIGPVSAQAADDVVDDVVNEFEGDTDAIAHGKERFGARCVYCHGGGGRGAKGPDLTDDKWKFGGSNERVFYNIAAGIPNTQMGAFGGSMEGDDIWKIIAYLRDENRKRHEAGEIKK